MFVGPETSRTAFAEEADTTVLAVGSRVGQPYEAGGWEVWAEFHPAYEAGDYEGVIERGRSTLETTPATRRRSTTSPAARHRPDEPRTRSIIFGMAFERRPSLRDLAREDTDFDPLRDEPAFRELDRRAQRHEDGMSAPLSASTGPLSSDIAFRARRRP